MAWVRIVVLWGLCLSAGTAPAASLAFLGAQGDLRLGADPLPEATRVLEESASSELGSQSGFSKVLGPRDVAGWLGGNLEDAKRCMERACLSQLAKALGVEQVMVAQWRRAQEDDLAVRIFLGVEGQTAVLREQFLVKKMSLASLQAQARESVRKLLEAARKTQGVLVVRTNVTGARILLNGRPVGAGTVEKALPGGVHQLRITAEGSPPYEQEVLLTRGGKRTLKVLLQRDERPGLFTGTDAEFARFPVVESTPAKAWEMPSVFKHPGLYAVAGGVAAAALGIVFGVQAKAVQGRMVDSDGDGRLNLTRAAAQSAQQKAVLANVLLGAGLSVAAAGGAWLYFAPIQAPPSKLVYPSLGVQAGVGGTLP